MSAKIVISNKSAKLFGSKRQNGQVKKMWRAKFVQSEFGQVWKWNGLFSLSLDCMQLVSYKYNIKCLSLPEKG